MTERSFWEKLRAGLARTREGLLGPLRAAFRGEKDEALLLRLEEVLLAADVGPEETARVVAAVAEKLPGRCAWEELLALVEAVLLEDLRGAERELALPPGLSVLLFVGVNGSGKTTTVAKVGRWLRAEGRRPLLVAADTFRAAAIEQLKELGEAAGLPVLAHRPGADPGAVVHDALEHAQASGYDAVLVDTAGRLQTKKPLMEELGKIRRVVEKMTGRAPAERILVVDATVGQNAISQAQLFHEAVGLTGLALTKLDGTARGGAVLPVVRALRLPILWVGTGKDLEDLAPFRAAEFVRALLRG
ncbi:MAG: signal recognition particle-docking protein FtsY [Candidatus Bipolaricaulota bacterium]|nr:signal recognition particle-docking protein FtsY [Candidatus Bipolaricaulota bacterium]MCX7844430.1 signal recognition particle-docking protein FtsY [Candidatus Bipolaricaulota bacterium]MDW8151596.1 signal recognition particle-docking protein FtsY [Candidatus Bipolaricaulota bacterium]